MKLLTTSCIALSVILLQVLQLQGAPDHSPFGQYRGDGTSLEKLLAFLQGDASNKFDRLQVKTQQSNSELNFEFSSDCSDNIKTTLRSYIDPLFQAVSDSSQYTVRVVCGAYCNDVTISGSPIQEDLPIASCSFEDEKCIGANKAYDTCNGAGSSTNKAVNSAVHIAIPGDSTWTTAYLNMWEYSNGLCIGYNWGHSRCKV